VKNYYKILEVSEGATQAEIKRSYRTMAKKYHPDKSSAPRAAQLFTEVNEAYGVLSDPEQKRQYDQRRSGSYQAARPHHPRTSRRRPPRPRPTYAAKKEQLDISPYVPFFRKISYAGFVLSVILSLDFVLPRTVDNEAVTKVSRIMARGRGGRGYVNAVQITTDKGAFRVGANEWVPINRGDTIYIYRSRILNYSTSVLLDENVPDSEFGVKASIYGNFFFSWIILLITSGVGSFLKKPDMSILNLGVVNGILILLVWYFMAVS